MKTILIFFITIIFFSHYSYCQFDLSKQKYYLTNRIVSFEYYKNSDLDSINNDVFVYGPPLGTGFFIRQSGRVFLITNKHVIDKILKTNNGDLIIRYPYYDTIKKDVRTIWLSSNIKDDTGKTILFSKDTCYDVCVIDADIFLADHIKNIIDYGVELSCFPESSLITQKDTINETDFIIFMGYPYGLSGNKMNHLIFRFGIISAVVNDIYSDICGNHYLINSESSKGDSGSPVFLVSLNPLINKNPKLIGVLSGEFFTGLSIVEPIKEVLEIITEYLNNNYNNTELAFYKIKKYSEAISKYKMEIPINQNIAKLYNDRGEIYRNLKKYNEAITDFTEAININSNYDLPYSNRGIAYFESKKYEEAISDYTEAIKLNPNFDVAYYNRGNTYNYLKKYDLAILDYSKAIDVNHNFAEAFNNRGNTYKELEQYDLAISDLNKSTALNPNYAEAFNNRGVIYYFLKKYDLSISDYTEAIKINPSYTNAYYNRGISYYVTENKIKACEDWRKAYSLGKTEAKESLDKLCE